MTATVIRSKQDLPQGDLVLQAILKALPDGCVIDGKPLAAGEGLPNIDASVLRYLIVHYRDEPGAVIHERGIRLQHFRISGQLDMAQCDLAFALEFQNCVFDSQPDFEGARLYKLTLKDCECPGLNAEGLKTRDDLMLEGSVFDAPINLIGAEIDGTLDCDAMRLLPSDTAMDRYQSERYDGEGRRCSFEAYRISISGNARFTDAEVYFGLRMVSAKIGGACYMSGIWIRSPEMEAVVLDRCDITGSLQLFDANIGGSVQLQDAQIGGSLLVEGARIVGEEFGGESFSAIHAPRMTVEAVFDLTDARLIGRLYVQDAHIKGNLDLTNCKIKRYKMWRKVDDYGDARRKTNSINAARLKVSGGFILKGDRSRIEHPINLAAASLGYLDDLVDCWPDGIVLDRCMYAAFLGGAMCLRTNALNGFVARTTPIMARPFGPKLGIIARM